MIITEVGITAQAAFGTNLLSWMTPDTVIPTAGICWDCERFDTYNDGFGKYCRSCV